jgi:hypothetical protein
MNYETIQADLKSRLESKISDFSVYPYPDDPENSPLNDVNGDLLIQYINSGWAHPEKNREAVLVQSRTLNWAVHIRLHNLNPRTGSEGMGGRVEQVRAALQGYSPVGPVGGTVIAIESDRTGGRLDEGTWHHMVFFNHTITETEAFA